MITVAVDKATITKQTTKNGLDQSTDNYDETFRQLQEQYTKKDAKFVYDSSHNFYPIVSNEHEILIYLNKYLHVPPISQHVPVLHHIPLPLLLRQPGKSKHRSVYK